MDIVEFLTACINEDEQWATEASRKGETYTPGGEHWQWERTDDDTVAVPDPLTGEYIADGDQVSLRSVEQYDTGSAFGPLPHFVVGHTAEMESAVAGHLVRQDPARTLRRVAAYRAILTEYKRAIRKDDLGEPDVSAWVGGLEFALKALASEFEDRPGFNPQWRLT